MEAAEKLYEARALIRRRRAMSESGILRGRVIVVAFFCIFISISFGSGFYLGLSSSHPVIDRTSKLSLLSVDRAGRYLRVSDSNELNPQEGKSFLLSVFFRLKRLPEEGENMMLISKYDPEIRSQRGYYLAIARNAGHIRPTIYWRNGESVGGVYQFSDIPAQVGVWSMITLSWSEGRNLGLHFVSLVPGEKVRVDLLGGYSLSVPVYPDAASDLLIGASQNGSFRGQVGPVIILSKSGRFKSIWKTIKQIAEDPSALPEGFTNENLKLQIFSRQGDSSPLAHEVVGFREERKRSTETRNEEDPPPEQNQEQPSQLQQEVATSTPAPTELPTVFPTVHSAVTAAPLTTNIPAKLTKKAFKKAAPTKTPKGTEPSRAKKSSEKKKEAT